MRNRRIIKRGENSYAIALMHSDIKDFGLVEGDMVNIDDLGLLCQAQPKKKKNR
jgi:hypothetical protein